jgi:hypothetical protein
MKHRIGSERAFSKREDVPMAEKSPKFEWTCGAIPFARVEIYYGTAWVPRPPSKGGSKKIKNGVVVAFCLVDSPLRTPGFQEEARSLSIG